MQNVGRVASIWRYPVKSMAGERLEKATVTFQGLSGDRMYAFVQAGSPSPFPWVTGREMPALLQYRPVWQPGDRPALAVRTPAGAELPVGSDELRTEIESGSGKPAYLLPNYRGSFDVAPVTFISHATVDRIGEASGTGPNPGRFRMNFYVETPRGEPFEEDQWLGKVLRIGESLRVSVTERDKRCVMITLDPASSESSPSVLRSVAELNDATAGVYGVVVSEGEVAEGDFITVE